MATISQVLICNMALDYIGATPIESLDENSKEAAGCKRWYEYSRLQSLSAYNWNFARRRLTLAPHGDDPPNEWAYRYQYPSDCVAARWITNPLSGTGPGSPFILGVDPQIRDQSTDAVPFEVEISEDGTKSILTNLTCPELVYTFNQTSPVLFSPAYVDALAFLMASRLAFSITGKRSIAKDNAQAYNAIIRNAGAIDATEAVDKPPREAEWIRGR